ncbi:hypothetical protein CH278_13110 [Rhodococcus sp. 05-2254-5]|uniref:hypothetical protein n=1 Tax=unclassified Rhodococcus (in: high G+C Gram-positive bacteria) TaxID=192944 RepID=UPI000B9BCCF9|nr:MULTISPECIES: hypothetical protein [unclassified Rhodococcus (in: high G+C Gram-positive bacteria)]OZE33552.1 hypothetical protein CH278_13110 [Rhodococcus sp. 05-2254-5]OZE51071.1 hypothetical protein CH269_26055 [Rhodococcus sp. 05-2254-1]
MASLIGSTWVLVFVGVVAAGTAGLRLALADSCEPMDRTTTALSAAAAVCGLAAPALVALA